MGGEWTTIGAIAQVFDGPHATPKKIDEGPYFLSISSLEAGKLDLEKSARLSEEQFEKWTRRVTPEEGDLLFSYETRLGEAALMPGGIKACLGRRMGLLRPDRAKVDARYLLFAYLGPAFQQEIRTRTNYGATVERIALKELPDFPIQIPPLPEQKAIAHILGSLDDKIELNRRMNATLEGMAQALFKSWFVDFDPVIDNALAAGNPIPDELAPRVELRKNALASSGEPSRTNGTTQQGSLDHPTLSDLKSLFPAAFQFTEELGWIPEGWEAKQFGGILAGTIGGDWGKEAEDEKHTRSAVIIRGTDMPHIQAGNRSSAPERWVEPKKFATRELQDSDIVIEISGGSPTQSTGRSLYITDSILKRLGGSVVPASFCRRFRPINRSHGLYGALHLAVIYQQGKMWEYQNQSTGISNFQTTSFLEREFVAYPPNTKLLEELYNRVRPLVDKSTSNQQELLAKLRDTLLPKLISGELRISEAEQLTEEAIA